MKKITSSIFITLVLFLISNSISWAQNRSSIYVHGLGGDETQWADWQALFNQERRMQTESNIDNEIASRTGVANFAAQVPTPPNNNTIVFGHSTGGVVARHIERTRVNPFGGIITAGAPMDGARISNNLANGQAANFIVNGVDKVLKGPIREFGPTAGVVFQVASHLFKDMAEREVNRVLNTSQTNATSTDLAEGSAYMNNGMRAQASAMPKIHIYGNENGPVLWRIASVAANWGDGELVSATQQGYEVCRALKLANIGKAITHPWNAIRFNYQAQGWGISEDWLKDGSERGWNDLIGASIPASITTSSQVLNYTGFLQCMTAFANSNGGQTTFAQYQQCQQQNTTTVFYTSYSPINGLSDGFIKAPSQTGYNSPWSNNSTRIEALGVNHLEMRSHQVMGDIYNRVFNGQVLGQDPFFITAIR